jgi:hypothetical protein
MWDPFAAAEDGLARLAPWKRNILISPSCRVPVPRLC